MNNGLNYIIYVRKSTESKDRQALSIEAQKRELQEFADINNLKVVKIFEESQSAYKLGRPVFDNMMNLCAEGLANGILVWKCDRLARNALDGGRLIQALDDKILQEIRTPYEVFRQEDNRMMLYVLFGMSNDFSRQISANVKRGNRQKYARGEFMGRAPVGYLNAKVGNSRNIIHDPVKAPIVRKIFEKYAEGKYALSDLEEFASSMGLTNIGGKKLHKSEIYRMLKSTVYYGVYTHGGEAHQGSYEPLISKDLHEKVRNVLSDRSKPRSKEWVHNYTGLIHCSSCGCSITAETKQKYYRRTKRHASYTYYRCTRRRGKCTEPAVTDRELEEMLMKSVSQISIDKEIWELGVKLLKAKHADEFKLHRKVVSNLELELQRIESSMEKLLTLRINEEITANEYAKNKKSLIEKKMEINEKISDRDHSTTNWLERAENFFETAYYARSVMQGHDMEAKRGLVQAVGSNLFLGNKILEFSFKKPFDVLLKQEMKSNVQGRRDLNPEKRFWRPL